VKTKPVWLRLPVVLGCGLLLSACSPGQASETPTETALTPTVTAPLPTATSAPTDTPPAPTPMPEEDGSAWDYVALGDCISGGGVGFGKSYPNLYADYIAEDLGGGPGRRGDAAQSIRCR